MVHFSHAIYIVHYQSSHKKCFFLSGITLDILLRESFIVLVKLTNSLVEPRT